MSVLFILVPLALLLAAGAAAAFVWSARQGQLDDLVTPALRVLSDDTAVRRAPHHESPASEHEPSNQKPNDSTAVTATAVSPFVASPPGVNGWRNAVDPESQRTEKR